ncbi:hypothetical protein [Pseudonocardia pini]|uniref:hypothetical protein n=1 Tax=Pseudonocardia pini TaxID=2758030 RepID=UPI0015F07187|nr:hypothetical protein [Pseudonocardia pini]
MLTDEKDAPSTAPAAAEEGTTENPPDADAVAVAEAGETDAPRRTRLPRPATLTAAFLLLLLVAGAVATAVWWNAGRHAEERRAAALSAAQDIAVALVSVSSDTADQDVRRILDGAVGDFGKIFSENLESYVDIVRKGGVQANGEVAAAGLERIDDRTARAFVAMRATVTNQQAPQGEERTYRMAVEVTEQPDGRWLADRVEFVP